MKRIGYLLICAVLIYFAMVSGPQASSQRSNDAVLGTAFFIRKDGVMLTNRHVVEGCKQLSVIPEDKKVYRASIIAISSDYDLAAIKVEGYTPKSFVPLRAHEDKRYVSIPEDGEKVMTGGFSDPLAMNFTISIVDGVTLGIKGYKERNSIDTIMLSSVKRGASGSAVVDYSNNLVGVVHSGIEELGKTLPRRFEKFNSAVRFHNNNAIADFLTKEGIEFYFRQSTEIVPRLQVVGFIYNTTALVVCPK